MSDMVESMKGSHNFLDIFRTKRSVKKFYKDHPDYFKPERNNNILSDFKGKEKH